MGICFIRDHLLFFLAAHCSPSVIEPFIQPLLSTEENSTTSIDTLFYAQWGRAGECSQTASAYFGNIMQEMTFWCRILGKGCLGKQGDEMIERGNGFKEWYSKHKGEQLADEIITLGYPAVDYLLEDLIEWVQDLNWPGAPKVADFLTTIGQPIIPFLKNALKENDQEWTYWLINAVIKKMPRELVVQLEDDLDPLIGRYSNDDLQLDIVELLISFGLGDQNTIIRLLRNQYYRHKGLYEQVLRIAEMDHLRQLNDDFINWLNSKTEAESEKA